MSEFKCQFCGNPTTRVFDSRPAYEGVRVRRRRKCECCGGRFTTHEVYEHQLKRLKVVDSNRRGHVEKYDVRKMIEDYGSANPTFIPDDIETQLNHMVLDHIEASSSVYSSELSSIVNEALISNCQKVAAVRHALTYKPDMMSIQKWTEEVTGSVEDGKTPI